MIATKTLCIFFDFSTLHFAHLMSHLPAELSSGAPTTLKTIRQATTFLLYKCSYYSRDYIKPQENIYSKQDPVWKRVFGNGSRKYATTHNKYTTGSELMRKKERDKNRKYLEFPWKRFFFASKVTLGISIC